MVLACPKCGSKDVRLSRRKGAVNKILRLLGRYLFRCDCCSQHFRANILSLRHMFYAKCPTCHRMDLGRWSREFYSPSFITRVMLALGARAVRCEYCRNNFWSFRLIRESFSKVKRASRSQVLVPVGGSSPGNHRTTPTPPAED